MGMKDSIRWFAPPGLISLTKRLRRDGHESEYGLSGDYHSWDEAKGASTGYDSGAILEKTRAALLKVKNGGAIYERDSVLFDEIQYAWPLLAGLMWAAARSGGALNVLDFGGSLGSTYFQNRVFLAQLPAVRWNIVEQPRHVAIGGASFEDEQLRFYESISNCLADTRPNIVLLSSVLQYLEEPYAVMDQLMELPCNHMIIDRTPFWAGPADRLCVQIVPPSIYPGSYPSWIFSMPRFYQHLQGTWRIVAKFDSLDRLNSPVKTAWHGFILERKGEEK